MSTYYLSLVRHFTPWSIPAVVTLVAALRTQFPTDDQLTVIPLGGAKKGIYKIVLGSDPPPGESVVLSIEVDKRLVEIPLVPERTFLANSNSRPGQGRADGVLITLYGGWQGPLKPISNQVFDEALSNYGEVTRPTDLQKHLGTDVFNGNRFCVLRKKKPTDKLPDRITLPNPDKSGPALYINCGYKGKERYCSRCLKNHVGACPELREFYAARDRRREQTITQRFLADSTLRHADETGLGADVVCMSGGRLGNVTHVLMDDPKMSDVDQVIVVAGQNDLLRDGESLATFQAIITTSLDKLQHTVYGKQELTIVQPLLPPAPSKLRIAKSKYYDELCLSKVGDTTHPLTYVSIVKAVEMDGIHPTVLGTASLLKTIQQRTKVITDGRFITDTKMYRGVQSVFNYGCLTCHEHLDLDEAFLCPACRPKFLPSEGQPSQDGPPGPSGNERPVAAVPPTTPTTPTTPTSESSSSPNTPTLVIDTESDYDMNRTSQKRLLEDYHTPVDSPTKLHDSNYESGELTSDGDS